MVSSSLRSSTDEANEAVCEGDSKISVIVLPAPRGRESCWEGSMLDVFWAICSSMSLSTPGTPGRTPGTPTTARIATTPNGDKSDQCFTFDPPKMIPENYHVTQPEDKPENEGLLGRMRRSTKHIGVDMTVRFKSVLVSDVDKCAANPVTVRKPWWKQVISSCCCTCAPVPETSTNSATSGKEGRYAAEPVTGKKKWWKQVISNCCCPCAPFPDTSTTNATSCDEGSVSRVLRRLKTMTEGGTCKSNKDSLLPHGAELLNEWVALHWEFICQWFTDLMENSLEPMLQAHVLASCKLTQCDLGLAPPKIKFIHTRRSKQTCPHTGHGNSHVTVQISGDISQSIKCTITIESNVGSISLTQIDIQGTIVVEFVKLQSKPPWFSGIRVFFPDAPQLSIHVETAAALGLDAFIDFKSSVERIVAHKILDLVKDNAVLPNCIAYRSLHELDFFYFKHVHPQGVLTVKLLDSAVCTTTSSAVTLWESEVCVGAESKLLRPLEEGHFVVFDQSRQFLRITALDTHGVIIGDGACKIAWFADNKEASCSEHCLHVKSMEHGHSHEGADMKIVALWRPITGPHQTPVNSIQSCRVGDESAVTKWLLMVDLFYASYLPAVESGTMHWVSISVCGPCGVHELRDSPCQPAQTPKEEGLTSIAPELREILQHKLSPAEWRHVLGRKGKSEAFTLSEQSADLVDVTWEHRFRELIDVHSSRLESVRSTEVVATVWRSQAGQDSDPKSCKIELGCANYKLDQLMLKEGFHDTVSLALQEGPAAPLGQLKLCFHICPTEAPHASVDGRLSQQALFRRCSM